MTARDLQRTTKPHPSKATKGKGSPPSTNEFIRARMRWDIQRKEALKGLAPDEPGMQKWWIS